MLLVHNDKPEVPDRREKGRPGADDEIDPAAADPLPLIVPGAPGYAAVNDGDLPLREAALDAREKLRREGDLRYKVDRAAAVPEHLIDSPQIDLGFPASRHAVEQSRREAFRGEARPDLVERFSLRPVQNDIISAFPDLR